MDAKVIKNDYEKQISDLKQLLEISRSLNSTLDFSILVDVILTTCINRMKVKEAAVFTKKELDHNFFTLNRNYIGFDLDYSVEYTIPEKSRLIKFLTEQAECITFPQLKEKVKNIQDIIPLLDINPLLVIPLIYEKELNGIIILGNKIDGQSFSSAEKKYLLSISDFAAIAIRNITLFEMTTTDMMTMLKIKHFFSRTLEKIVEDIIKAKKVLSLLMLDIDHFKKLNDSFGHIFGDKVLIQIAGIIRENIRQKDVGARYGGEEFSVILPGTDLKTAFLIGERIRSSIENLKIVYPGTGELVPVTISIGVAQFDLEKDKTAEDIINEADKALYTSKDNGRNRISSVKGPGSEEKS